MEYKTIILKAIRISKSNNWSGVWYKYIWIFCSPKRKSFFCFVFQWKL